MTADRTHSQTPCPQRFRPKIALAGVAAAAVLALGSSGLAQSRTTPAGTIAPAPPAADSVPAVWTVVPQRPIPRQAAGVRVSDITVDVEINGPVAVTRMRVGLMNPSARPVEAELVLPVPDGSAIRSFGLEGLASDAEGNPTATLLPRDEARAAYRRIVSRMIDPGLLEFAGWNLIRSSVFPVPANGVQHFQIAYEHVMPADGARREYVLPRSEALDQAGINWTVRAVVRGDDVGTVFSPSHEVVVERPGGGDPTVSARPGAMAQPGAFRLSVVSSDDTGLPISVIACPDRNGDDGGTFMVVAGAPELNPASRQPREVTVVIDRSGSMRGEKLEQARSAALQVIEALGDDESFNVIDYADTVSMFRPAAVRRTDASVAEARAYVAAIKAIGGTNIHDAVRAAVNPAPASDTTLPLVLFMTDGLPTIGSRSEAVIRKEAVSGNPHQRRVFPFGVGFDVNAPLLTGLARDTRAAATFVQPSEDVEVAVGGMFRKLNGPVLTNPSLRAVGRAAGGAPVRDLMPARLPDLFAGEQLIALGRYVGQEPFTIMVSGRTANADGGRDMEIGIPFDPKSASAGNGYVPRLWAQRRIAGLIEEIRLAAPSPGINPSDVSADPARKELVDEIVRLSLEFGILTEYTAFLAAEPEMMLSRGGVPIGGGSGGGGIFSLGAPVDEAAPAPEVDADTVYRFAGEVLERRAGRDRAGVGAVSQELNLAYLVEPTTKMGNRWLDDSMTDVAVVSCQNFADLSMFQR
ncbi:MAG: VIT domain-containing protein, partial [Phycisphaerales bacterium]